MFSSFSCIKVALDFVSPENVGECIRLTEEFRLLPKDHRAKEDKLEVKKMTLYAVDAAVKEAKSLMKRSVDAIYCLSKSSMFLLFYFLCADLMNSANDASNCNVTYYDK
ncbi:hypothetical protein JRO89_XS03G0142200 [Xanthoceras sorbifolium]|uniref:Uncharacterized protein n=1 Tax=Xanthoceras sorbifolium TaxID=99658 RepID=A0ABQ8IA11_9ROSI|nr:hypothetical protein JRO89_XS03G0142200 [Xanthoceras sorbifolium]